MDFDTSSLRPLDTSALQPLDKQPAGLDTSSLKPLDTSSLKQLEEAPAVQAPAVEEEPAPRDLLAEHQAAGNLDSNGRVTLQSEIAADRENRSWLERNVSHPLQRGFNNLQQGIAANHLDKARGELEALDAIERGEKPKSGDGHAMVLALAHGKDPGFIARRRAELQRQIGQYSAEVVQQGAEAAAVPQSPVVRRVNEASASGEGWSQAWRAFTSDPTTYIANMGLESGPQSAVSMIVGLAAARSGGRAGATGRLAAGAGVGSGMVEYASSLVDAMQQFGVNVQDPAAIQAAATNPEMWEKVQNFAEKRATVVGAFDAATMGIAGKNLVPQAVKGTVAREVLNIPLQAPIQGAGGALGEVGASLATGQEITPGAVMGEFFGEMATAPVDIATAAVGKHQADNHSQAPREFITPGEIEDQRKAEEQAYQNQLARQSIAALDPNNVMPGHDSEPALSSPIPVAPKATELEQVENRLRAIQAEGGAMVPGTPRAAEFDALLERRRSLRAAAGREDDFGAGLSPRPVAPAEPPPVGQEVAPASSPAPVAPPRGNSTAQLQTMMADPRPVAEIMAEEEQRAQAEAEQAEAQALGEFGLEKGARVVMSQGQMEPETVVVKGAYRDEEGNAVLKVRTEDGVAGYNLLPGEASFSAIDGTGTREAPVKASAPEHVAVAAKQAEADPTPAQKEAGNYQKGHLRLQGLDITLENARGSTRSGVSPDGQPWSVDMPAHYGYVKRTEGADGDHVDVYIGERPDTDLVLVVDQIDPRTGKFDEHKAILGAADHAEAMALYDAGFSDGSGPARRGAFTAMTMAQFKEWLHKGNTKKPLAWKPAPKPAAEPAAAPQPEAAAAPGGLSQESGAALPAESVPDEPTPPAPQAQDESPFPDEWHRKLYEFGRALLDGRPVHATERNRLWAAFRGFVAHDPVDDAPFAKPNDIDKLAEDYAYDPDGYIDGGYVIEPDRQVDWVKKLFSGAKSAVHDEKGTNPALKPSPLAEQVAALPDEELRRIYGESKNRRLRDAVIAEMQRRDITPGGRSIPQPDAQQSELAAEPPPRNEDSESLVGAPEQKQTAPAEQGAPLVIESYSDKAIIVRGDTKAHKDALKAAGGRWHGTAKGWIFPKKREAEVRAKLGGLVGRKDGQMDPAADIRPPVDRWSDEVGQAFTDGGYKAAQTKFNEIANRENLPLGIRAAFSDKAKSAMTAAGWDGSRPAEDQPAPKWMTSLTPEGLRQLAVAAGFSTPEAARISKMNWTNISRDPAIVERMDAQYRRGDILNRADAQAAQQSPAEVQSRESAQPAITDREEGPAAEEEAPLEQGERTEPLADPGDGALEAVPAVPVSEADGRRNPGDRGTGSRADDARGDGADDADRRDLGRGVGSDSATVVVPARGEGRDRGANADDAGASRDGRPEPGSAPQPGLIRPAAHSYVITEADRLGEGGGQVAKFNDNIAAIKLLRRLQAENRLATQEEQAVLVRYVGWGGIKPAFPDSTGKFNKGWEARGAELRELLTADEWESARRTVLDAHYTSQQVVQGIYASVRHMGFQGGAVLEPSMGTGNFFGLMPLDLRSHSQLTGVEFDAITGGIAKQLYQGFNILAPMGYQDAKLADNHFDLAVGNPPFGAQRVPGAKEKEISSFSIHNYFFARTINKLRPGGVMAMVVTRNFLDKSGGRERAYIAHRAEFLGAVRLPNTAFQQNALTEVTTDIVFLKKLPEDKWGTTDSAWLEVATVPDPLGGDPIPLNRYFIDHPEMLLGRMERSGTMYARDNVTLAPDGRDIAEALAEAVKRLPADAYEHSTTIRTTAEMVKLAAEVAPAAADYDVGSFFLEGDKLMRREESPDGSPRAAELSPDTQWTEKTKLGESRFKRIVGMVRVREAVRKVLRLEASDAPEAQVDRARAHLNKVYDEFQAESGFLNDRANEQLFADDPDAPLLLALENGYNPGVNHTKARQLGIKPVKPSAEKAAIFSQRVIPKWKPVEKAANGKDALAITLAERGFVDMTHMQRLTGTTEEELARELFDEAADPLIFKNPETGAWETASMFLSGNVKAKHKAAVESGAVKEAEVLRAVFPPDIPAGEIRVRLGASWVNTRHYEAFIKHLLGDEASATIAYLPSTGGFGVSIRGGSITAQTAKWGTSKIYASELLDKILNNREIVVHLPPDPDGRRAVDKDGTMEAQAKASDIRDEFADWIMRDADRRAELTAYYNEHFNNNVEPKFDGSHLTLPGKNPLIRLRRHQRNAVWRILQTRNALLDHVVGAGKTFTIVAAAMELRRTGLAKKPMVVVPNHLVSQWASDFYRLYPGAKLLTMTKRDFEKKNRRRMLARIATGDYDAIIIAHSSFGFVPVSAELQSEFITKQIAEIQQSIDAMRQAEGKDGRRVADLVRSQENMKARLKELADKPKDDLLTWEELGVDQLFVDEAHEFKNLFFTTSRRGMLGLGNPTGSKKAFDLFIKTQWLLRQHNGQGYVSATGTPISNSLTEMYTVQRYHDLPALEQRGILSFDAWLNNFGNDYSDYELDGSGVKYKQVNRLRALTNLPEVMGMYRQYADSVTLEQIKAAYAEENKGAAFPVPKVKGGKARENVVVPRSMAQAAYFADIIRRAANIKPGGDDNMLNITTDARKAALDIRLVDSTVEDEPGSKTHEAADRIADIFRRWEKDKGTQLVFLDLSIPLSAAKSEGKALRALLDEIADLRAKIDRTPEGDTLDDLEDKLEGLEEKLTKTYSPDDIQAVAAAERGFSVYDDLRDKLIDRGVNPAEIAFIHDYGTDAKKAELFEAVNAGKIRVLFGSTTKMGAGTNVQQRLVALHHIDCPWRPSDIEQREGRIVRQGNLLLEKYGMDGFEVEVFAYATEQTYDARMWQTQEQKLLGIEGLRNYKGEREMDEVAAAAASAAEMKAAATGNPLILEDVQLAEAIRKLEAQQKGHRRSQYDLEDSLRLARELVENGPARLENMKADAKTFAPYREDPYQGNPPKGTVAGKEYTSAREAAQAAAAERERQSEGQDTKQPKYAVEINGKTYSSQEAIHVAIVDGWGDLQPITVEHHGRTFRSRAAAAKAISGKLDDGATVKIAGFEAEIHAEEGVIFQNKLTVTARVKGKSGAMTVQVSQAKDEKPEAVVRSIFDSILRRLDRIDGDVFMLERKIERAEKEIPQMEAEVGKPWPKETELSTKKARHAEVRKALSDEASGKPEEPAKAKDDDVPFALRRDEEGDYALRMRASAAEYISAIATDLRQRLDARGLKHVRLVTPEQIAGGQADGYYMRRVIAVALDTIDKARILDHEVIHALRKLEMFRPGEWAALEKMAREKWMDQYDIRGRYAGLDMTEEQLLEEAVADAFADWAAGSYKPGGLVLRVFNLIRKFLNAIYEAFGAKGFHTVDSVFSDALEGRIGRRDKGTAQPVGADGMAGLGLFEPEMAAAANRQQVEDMAGEAASFLLRRKKPPASPAANAVPGEDMGLAADAGILKRWFVHPRTIAALHRSFVPVYRTAVKQFETRDEIAAELSRMLEPYMDLSVEAKRKVNAALELGRLSGTVIRTNNLTAIKNDGYPHAKLSKPGEMIRFTPEEAAAYKAVRTAMDTALELFKQQVIREWGLDPSKVATAKEIEQLAVQAATHEEQVRLKKLAEIVREIEQAKRQGYVPFQRWGQVGVIVKKDGAPDPKTGQIQQETVYFEMVEVGGLLQQAKRAVGLTPEEFGQMPEVKAVLDRVKATFGNKAGHEIKVFQVPPNTPMAGQVQMADLDMLAQVAQLDQQTWDAVRDGLQTAIQQRGFRSHFFGARNIPGYSADFERAIADYVVGVAGYLARRQFSDTWQRAIDAIPRTMPKLKEYAQRYHAYVQNPTEEFQMLRQVGFLYYLAGSIATAMVNMTQVPIITAPYLTQFYGKAGVMREMARAYKDALGMLTRRKGMDLFDPAKAPADMKGPLQLAWDQGFFVPLNTWEVMGLAHNRTPALRGLSKKAKVAVDAIAILFTMAERMNRLVTFIAAYRMAKKPEVAKAAKQVLKNNALARSDELLRQFTPEKFAEWCIDETHFRMGKVNRPSVMRGAGAALLQFKGFVMQTLELFFRLAAQNGREGKVALAMMLVILFSMSGFWGLPFAEDATDLLEFIAKKFSGLDLDVRTEVRELIVELTGMPKLAEAFARGGGRVAGVDLTRIGMGKIIPHDMEELGGIPFSMTLGRVGQAIEYGKRGQGLLAFGEMLPQFLKNPIHAYAWGSEGIRSQATGKVVIPGEDITVAQQMLKGIGFTPGRISNARESEFAQNRANRAATEIKAGFYGELARLQAQYLKAEQDGDTGEVKRLESKIAEVFQDIAKFNESRPDYERVKIDRRSLQDRVREEILGAKSRDKKAPKQARARRQQIDEIYGTAD